MAWCFSPLPPPAFIVYPSLPCSFSVSSDCFLETASGSRGLCPYHCFLWHTAFLRLSDVEGMPGPVSEAAQCWVALDLSVTANSGRYIHTHYLRWKECIQSSLPYPWAISYRALPPLVPVHCSGSHVIFVTPVALFYREGQQVGKKRVRSRVTGR